MYLRSLAPVGASVALTVTLTSNVARVISFWDNGVLTFTREEEKQYPSGTFNRANTTGNHLLKIDFRSSQLYNQPVDSYRMCQQQ